MLMILTRRRRKQGKRRDVESRSGWRGVRLFADK